jgi:hypothetical protein
LPANIFISYDHDDVNQVNGFKGLISNPNHPLDPHDHSLPEPVKDPRTGQPIKVPPSDPRAEPVKQELRRRFGHCSRLVVLIGDDTHSSLWVDWEIKTFYDLKSASGLLASHRIRGMRLKGSKGGDPAALKGRSMATMDWDPTALDAWLAEPL